MIILIRFFRALFRLLGLGMFTAIWIVAFYFTRHPSKDRVINGLLWRRKWLNAMLPFLGVKVELKGKPRDIHSPVIYVGNHRSYVDPVVAAKYAESVVVSKSEVARWPLIGKGIQITGVVFVRRENKESRSATLSAMEQLLRSGIPVMVYPEGTTTRFPGLLPFRPRTFELSATLGVPVVPMAIEYEDPDVAWVGDDTFIPHFFRIFGKRSVKMHITLGPEMTHSQGEVLARMTHDWIASELHVLSANVKTEG